MANNEAAWAVERNDLVQKLEGEMKKYRELTAEIVEEQRKYKILGDALAVEQGKVKEQQKEIIALQQLLQKEKARTGRPAIREWWETGTEDWKTMWQRVIGHDDEVPEETEKEIQVIVGGLPPYARGKVLEIGAGVGRLLRGILPFVDSAVGVDASESYVKMSSEYLKGHDCAVLLTDGQHFPFFDNSFSLVFSYTCFQHMPTIGVIRANLHEANRVLTVGGYLRFQTVHGEPNPEAHDGWTFASRELLLAEVSNAGFVDIQIQEGLTNEKHFWVTARKPGPNTLGQ